MIYCVQRKSDNLIKIGYTSNFKSRAYYLKREHGELISFGYFKGEYAEEAQMHRDFAHLRVEKEWFKPDTELIEFLRVNAVQTPNAVDDGYEIQVTPVESRRFCIAAQFRLDDPQQKFVYQFWQSVINEGKKYDPEYTFRHALMDVVRYMRKNEIEPSNIDDLDRFERRILHELRSLKRAITGTEYEQYAEVK